MKTWQKVLAYAAALVVVLGVAIGVGRLVGPLESDEETHGAGHGSGHDDRIRLEPADGGHSHEDGGHSHGAAASYELDLEQEVLDSGRPTVAFRVLDGDGEPVTSYDVQHEKELHLIAVRRDLAEFRHVHPRLDAASGRWSAPIALDAGPWHLYADFAPRGGEPSLAEAEVMVSGDFAPAALGPDRLTSEVDGYEVRLERDAAASTLTLHVTRGGAEVTDLQPYLGAYGHLVAIGAGDLDYLHVHPEDGPAGPEIGFHAELPEDGRYRLFLDFRHRGRVHTADFTLTGGKGENHGHGHEQDDHDHEDHDH